MTKFLEGRVSILRDDITVLNVDAIVNAANESLLGGGGVDGAIHRAAGPELLEACRSLGGAKTGDAKITPGFALEAAYVIHAVGPVWHGGDHGEAELLRGCYVRALELASRHDVRRIAFPCISTGVYGYPIEPAAEIAQQAVRHWLEHEAGIEQVVFCCFSDHDLETYCRVASRVLS